MLGTEGEFLFTESSDQGFFPRCPAKILAPVQRDIACHSALDRLARLASRRLRFSGPHTLAVIPEQRLPPDAESVLGEIRFLPTHMLPKDIERRSTAILAQPIKEFRNGLGIGSSLLWWHLLYQFRPPIRKMHRCFHSQHPNEIRVMLFLKYV